MPERNSINLTSTFATPTPLTSDYIQLMYLIFIFCLGVPFNVYTFIKLIKEYYIQKSSILLLYLHLNVSDLMILFFFALAKSIWIITYKWNGGIIFCKILKCIQSLSFTMCSNIIVCIGFDRLFSAALQQSGTDSTWKCKQILLAAWVVGFICSAPQLHVWTVFELTPTWTQCTDIWSIWNYYNITTEQSSIVQIIYTTLHSCFTFWLQCIIALITNLIILYRSSEPRARHHQPLIEMRTVRPTNYNHCDEEEPETSAFAKTYMAKGKFGSRCSQNVSVSQHGSATPETRENERIKQIEYSILKITYATFIAYFILWLPYNIIALWKTLDYEFHEIVSNYTYILYGLLSMNAAINPLLFARLSHLLRERHNSPAAYQQRI